MDPDETMSRKTSTAVLAIAPMLLCSMLLASTAWAQDSAGEPGRGSGEPNPLNNVYFGEQHLHTQDSPDAFAMGTRNSQDDAYNFAEGKAIKKSTTRRPCARPGSVPSGSATSTECQFLALDGKSRRKTAEWTRFSLAMRQAYAL